MVGALLNLSLQHDASSAGSIAHVTVRNITAMLAGETDGANEMDEDSMSTVGSSSSASDSPQPPRRDIFDGKGADKRRKAFHALQAVLCGVGDVVHPCMVHWAAIDRSLLAILKPLVLATATVMYKAVQRQSTFIGGLEAILLLNGHGIHNRLDECFEVAEMWADCEPGEDLCNAGAQSRCRCGQWLSPVPAQMWAVAEPSPGADVGSG
jgi:hypothetical protein